MTNIKHRWRASEYHKHSSVQKEAAMRLIQSIQLRRHEHVLDVGCGDGKITAIIAELVPDGKVIGIDSSSEMIRFASHTFSNSLYSHLTFLVKDAQQFDYSESFDIIFSSFALQWLPNPSQFFKSAYLSLKLIGRLALTIPLGISIELEKAIQMIVTLPQWFSFFQNFSPKWHFLSIEEYKILLFIHNFNPSQFTLVEQVVFFSSRESFKNYISPWFSYLDVLPRHLKKLFLTEIIEKYLEINPQLSDGRICFKFSRLDIIATKNLALNKQL